jgi:hypothetical protein
MQPLIFAAALPITLLAEGAVPAVAGNVSVTGANGANGSFGNPGGAGGDATATTTTTMFPGDPSNTATAQGGRGGYGERFYEACILGVCRFYQTTPGGRGGSAMATATTTNTPRSASATAVANGGAGGNGVAGTPGGIHGAAPGAGGPATATSSAAESGAGLVTSIATANGGAGGGILNGIYGAGGTATATASGQSTGSGAVDVTASASGGYGGYSIGGGGAALLASATGVALTGNVQANASAKGGAGATPGTAVAKSDAKNSHGEAVTTASAPGGCAGTSPSALTLAGVGSGNVALASAFTPGQVVANAVLTPGGGAIIGVGAMSAAYGGLGPLQYVTTSGFDFTTSTSEALDLELTSDEDAGIGLDSLKVEVAVNGATRYLRTFYLGSAETFFTNNHLIPLGTFAAEGLSVSITYDLTYNGGTQAVVGNGFGFTYDLVDPPLSVPETSTWVMMLVGFAGFGCAGRRAWRRRVVVAKQT